ncbi:MAG: 23S rRNA (pseudouridine(1915)-N(3))-methyltransferase RlmH [Hyphomicrobiales bacterium]|nr:23S rRNA (pseudouridine(1915)-N(3))-methyltransferase RlmH [Hyphomicrobiales bacterium]
MRLTIGAVGRLKVGPERDLCQRYAERAAAAGKALSLSGPVLREAEESRARRPEDRKSEEAGFLRAFVPSGAALVALDERGKTLTSADFAALIARWRDSGRKDACFLIGGADGLDSHLRDQAEMTLSFGAMTLPHQLVRVLALEQIYRAVSILSGHPYHRA